MPYYYFLKGLEILHQEIRGQVNTIVMGYFHNLDLLTKQHTNQLINQSINQYSFEIYFTLIKVLIFGITCYSVTKIK